jgi:hypothetical protein
MSDDHLPPQPGPARPGDPPSGSASTTPAPAVLSRKELRQQAAGTKKTTGWQYAVGAVAVVVVAAAVALVVTSGTKHTATKQKAASVAVATTVPPAPASPTCPLTGQPAPGGTVPPRPAVGVKIGNYPADRPSAGLNQADIVFEEPVEGSITRLVAVFQCQTPTTVGDLRSAREPDVGILSQLSDPLFVHMGGINPVIALLQSAPLIDENAIGGKASSIIFQQAGRYAPYATFTHGAALWSLDPTDTTPPAPIFKYSTTLPAGSVAGSGASVHIPFSSVSDVTWTWDPSTGTYLRSYSGTPDILVDGTQTAATNVVVMTVQTSIGPWVENSEGGREVFVTATGTGPLVVLRNGVAITGTWSRSSLTSPATLTASNGTPITLQPGNTWEELVPAGIPVTTAGTGTGAATGS